MGLNLTTLPLLLNTALKSHKCNSPMNVLNTGTKLLSGVALCVGIMSMTPFVFLYLWVCGSTVGAWRAVNGSRYWQRTWLGFDYFCNALLGGSHKETISSRLGKSVYYGYPPVFVYRRCDKIVVSWLHAVDRDHCRKWIRFDVGRTRSWGES